MDHELHLYYDGKSSTEIDLQRLKEKREEITADLEGVRLAMEELSGNKPGLEEVLAFIEAEDWKRRTIAFSLWPELAKFPIPVRLDKAAEAFGVPDKVGKLLEAGEAVERNGSRDPSRYWDKKGKQFRSLPITDEEREGITQRNRRYLKDPRDVDTLKMGRALARLINRANVQSIGRVTPASIKTNSPWLAELLTWSKAEHPAHAGQPFYQYGFDETGILFKGEPYQAFDE